MKKIHYLIKNTSGEKGGLIYPNEIDGNQHYTVGNLYILGTKVQKKYILHAIKDEKILELTLVKVQANKFTTTVDDIGDFIFYAESVSMQTYTGSNTNIEDENILRRLRLDDEELAEAACNNHKFYFIGYSAPLNG